jgi:hypothetical protein
MKALIAGTIAAGLLTAAALPVQAQTPGLNMQDNARRRAPPARPLMRPARR